MTACECNLIRTSCCSKFTVKREACAQVVLDDLNQVTAAVALRTPDLCETVSEGRRELCKNKHHSQTVSTFSSG